MPRLPHKVRVDVAKRHACHAKRCGATASHLKPSTPPEPAQCHKCHACHATWMSPSATPATQSEGGCRQVPRLPRKETVDFTKCHACLANSCGGHGVIWEPGASPEPARHQSRPSGVSATPATQSERQRHQVKIHVAKCHACHAK